ncbi:MAG: DUF481 domain-containing protein [Salinivenus sp.]
MPRLFACVFVAFLALPAAAIGQVNTERMRALDVEGVRTTVGSDVALQAGNADLFEIGANGRVDVRQLPHSAFFVTQLRYGIKDDEPFRDRTFGHLRYNYHLRPSLVAEGFTQLERDGFARLRLRVLAGGGLRVQYLNTETLKIFQGTTPMYEREVLEAGADAGATASSTVRWSNYLNVRLRLTENTHLMGTVYVQPRLDAFDDVRLLHQSTLAVQVTDHVRLTTDLDLRYDSRPPAEIEDFDLTLRNGLEVSF